MIELVGLEELTGDDVLAVALVFLMTARAGDVLKDWTPTQIALLDLTVLLQNVRTVQFAADDVLLAKAEARGARPDAPLAGPGRASPLSADGYVGVGPSGIARAARLLNSQGSAK